MEYVIQRCRQQPRPLADRWIRSRAEAVVAEVQVLLTDFQLGEAARAIRDFVWPRQWAGSSLAGEPT